MWGPWPTEASHPVVEGTSVRGVEPWGGGVTAHGARCPARPPSPHIAASARRRQPASKQCLKPILIRLIYE